MALKREDIEQVVKMVVREVLAGCGPLNGEAQRICDAVLCSFVMGRIIGSDSAQQPNVSLCHAIRVLNDLFWS